MTRSLTVLLALVLGACGTLPAAAPSPPEGTRSPGVTTPGTVISASPAPSPVPTVIPTVAAPTPTAVPPTALPPPVASAAAPTPSTVPLSPGPGPIRNDGQKILASLDRAIEWFFGEGSSAPGTSVANYTLNGTSLAGSSLRCTEVVNGGRSSCRALEIIPSLRLQNGVRYELALARDVLGSFVATGLVAATPHVTSVSASQYKLTVTFDRPMLHAGDCGTHAWTMGVPGTMEWTRTGLGFPAAVGGYTSSSAAYRVFLSSFVSQADLNADCTSVTFGSGWGGPIGDIDVTVSGVVDQDGNAVTPRTVRVHIDDEGLPKLMFAQLELQTAEKKVIRVAYSEDMDEEYVTDPERYYLNGRLVDPTTTAIECEIAGCAWVRLTFQPSAFGYGSKNTLTIIGVRDMAGNAMDPDIVTSGTFEVY